MDKSISEMPLLKYLFRHAGVIPICSPKKCIDTYTRAFERIHQALANEELVCIFPEAGCLPMVSCMSFGPVSNRYWQRILCLWCLWRSKVCGDLSLATKMDMP